MKLNREEARQEIRQSWRAIIPEYTQPARRNVNGETSYICPFCGHGTNGDGLTRNPRSKDGNGLICFGCGFSGDILDLIQQETGADYNTALQDAAAELGIEIEPYRASAAADFADTEDAQSARQTVPAAAGGEKHADALKSPETGAQTPTAAAAEDFTAYYRKCAAQLEDPAALSYLQARGIGPATANRFLIGYDPAWISPTAVRNQRAKGSNWTPPATARIIMPVSKNHYVARAISPDVKDDYKKMNETGGGSSGIFNRRALYEDNKAVFVVEGIFDALSIIETGGAAVALNSTENANLFIEQLEQQPTTTAIIICLDNDNSGRRAAETIRDGLNRLNIDHITADVCGDYKDPNEALTGDRAAFEAAIKDAEKRAETGDPPGLLTYSDAVSIFEAADDSTIELKSFPTFSKTAKIKRHDSVVIAADTGVGKSSLAINFLNDLNADYPCIYLNLEMDAIDVLRRLAAIHSGIEIDRIEGYKNDEKTAAAVNITLQAITGRKPLQVIQGAYMLEDIEEIIKRSTKGRADPTMVFIDHSLLVDTKSSTGGRYDRFTQISEGLRKMALRYDVVLFVLLQQSRAGKADENERPKNSSLKESGSWENDATQICFLWYDPDARRKKLLLTKNRHGSGGEFALNYWQKTQTYTEAAEGAAAGSPAPRKPSKRDRQKMKLISAYNDAYIATFGQPTLQAIADAAGVTTSTIKTWIKEYGGFMIDGKPVDPAGIDVVVEQQFVKLTPADDSENPFEGSEQAGPAAGKNITASF